MTVLVFGHKNPDTDAICAAIAYAHLLRQTSHPDTLPACCGPANSRTEFALQTAGIEMPRIIMDVRPEVQDVCHHDVVSAKESEVFYTVYQRLDHHKLRSIPVLNDANQLVGLLHLLDLLELIFQGDGDPMHSRLVPSSLQQICQTLGGHFLHQVDPERREELMVTVGAMSAQKFTEHLGLLSPERTIVVCGDRPTIQLPALEQRTRCLIITGGLELSPGLLALAQANDVNVIVSPHDTATSTIRIKSSRSIEPAIQKDFITLSAKQPVDEAREQLHDSAQSIFPVVDDSGELIGVISKSDLANPPKPQLILVDHNELSQAVNGAEGAEILEVLDHHRLGGGLRSAQPMRFLMEPVGSTCTLVAQAYQNAQINPPPEMALCMAAGLISDTLHLRSPTATQTDRNILDWLATFCTVDLDDFAQSFFEVGSALRTELASKVVREDCKEFEEGKHRFSISQIEEIGFDLFWSRKQELALALEDLTTELQLDFSALLVTDIVSNGSLLLMSREPASWEDINYPRVDLRLYKLDNVVSRKKQLLPLIVRLLATETK